jgi:hypothetical protein
MIETQPLTEMSTRNLSRGKGRPVRRADNHIAICEAIVYQTWEPRRLANLWAFMACYRISLPVLPFYFKMSSYQLLSENPVSGWDSSAESLNLLL